MHGDQAQTCLAGNVHCKHGSSLVKANLCVLSCPAMPSSDAPAGCGSNSRYLKLFSSSLNNYYTRGQRNSPSFPKNALFKCWLTQNKLKYIDYRLTKYRNETTCYVRCYEMKIPRKPLLRHNLLLTSGAWLNFFQDGGIPFAIFARISGTISTF